MFSRIRIVPILALSLLPFAAQAQKGVKFGILLGANVSTVSDAKEAAAGELGAAIDAKRRKGFDGGVFVQIPLAGMLSLQPEAHYAQKGVSLAATDPTAGAVSLDLKIDYAEIPVLLRLDLGSAAIHPVLMGGASFALRMSCKTGFTGGGTSVETNCDEDLGGGTAPSTDPFKKNDMSLVGGAGLAMSAAGRSLLLQLRYTQGMTKIATEDTNGTSPKNGTFALLLALGF